MRNLKNNLYIIRIIWSAAPARIVFELLTVILSSVSSVVYDLFFMRFLIECLQNKAEFGLIALVIVIYYVFGLLARALDSYLVRYLRPLSNAKIQERMMEIIYDKALRMDLECYEDAEFYDAYTRANEEIVSRTDGIISILAGTFNVGFSIVGYGVAVLAYDPVIVAFLVVGLTISQFFQKRYVENRFKRQNEAVKQRRRMDYAKRVVYLADYAKDLRLTNVFAPVMKNFHIAAQEARDIAGMYGKKAGIFRLIRSIISSLTVALGVNAFILYRYLVTHAYSLGVMTTIMNASNGLNGCLSEVINLSNDIAENGAFIENYRKFVEYVPKMRDREDAIEVENTEHELVLNNVSFSYPGSDRKILTDISMTIKPGEKIALVGHNGAGKSTLVKLLLRLYDPTEGSIFMDGRNINDIKIMGYRRQFGTIFQDFKVYAASVAENVLLRKISTDKDEQKKDKDKVKTALIQSGVWSRIEKLPHGLDTILTKEFDQDGALLSGGEAQKLAVARVFAEDNHIAILDEPSSALDPISEYKLFESMMEACEGKTVIFVSHRLSSATLADKIYLLEQGQIKEAGSHHELMQKKGTYYDMFSKQAENYKKEKIKDESLGE